MQRIYPSDIPTEAELIGEEIDDKIADVGFAAAELSAALNALYDITNRHCPDIAENLEDHMYDLDMLLDFIKELRKH